MSFTRLCRAHPGAVVSRVIRIVARDRAEVMRGCRMLLACLFLIDCLFVNGFVDDSRVIFWGDTDGKLQQFYQAVCLIDI